MSAIEIPLFLRWSGVILSLSESVKALSDDTIFACDCSRLHQTRFQSCRVRGTIVSCETNLRQSGGIGANRVKKSRRVRGSRDSSRFNKTWFISRSFQKLSYSTFNFQHYSLEDTKFLYIYICHIEDVKLQIFYLHVTHSSFSIVIDVILTAQWKSVVIATSRLLLQLRQVLFSWYQHTEEGRHYNIIVYSHLSITICCVSWCFI